MDGSAAKSQDSFDSSVDLPSVVSTQRTVSLQLDKPKKKDPIQGDLACQSENLTPEKSRSIDLLNANQINMFVGFQNGFNGKNIDINKSKLKRAQKFFDDTQEIQEGRYLSNPFFAFSSKKKDSNSFSKNKHNFEQLSMPCFKSVLNGIEVKISKQAQNKVKLLFQQTQSFKKPTKVKKGSKVLNQQSFLKTVNQNAINQKQKNDFSRNQAINFLMVPQKQNNQLLDMNRKSFNWEQYQKQYNQQVRRKSSIKKSASKRLKRDAFSKSKSKNRANQLNSYDYSFLRLQGLAIGLQKEFQCSRKLNIQSRNIKMKRFSHIISQCNIFKCVLCSINFSLADFGISELYEVMNKEFAKKWINFEDFQSIYEQTYFKLLKYSIYWPQILNKRCEPNNLIVQINKKFIKMWQDLQCSFLKRCLSQDQVGRKVNLIVKQKTFNNKMQIIFLKLSDGWFSVWAAIQSHNLLYNYLRDESKVRIGTKLSICLWNLHPINNINQFCSLAKPGDIFIQFHYNGSIILKPNAKLGYTKQEFYRPLTKCRYKGGVVPMVQGIIIRLFSCKQKGKKNNLFSHHFAQILTPQGIICLIQFVLGQENSLVEYFRLYRSYLFFKLKITDEKILSFSMDSSKFVEIKGGKVSQKDQIYPQIVLSLLKGRWIGSKRESDLQQGKVFDLISQKGKAKVGEKSYTIKFSNESVEMNLTTLYQQFQLLNKQKDQLLFCKKKWSSQVRRLPAIYNKLISEM